MDYSIFVIIGIVIVAISIPVGIKLVNEKRKEQGKEELINEQLLQQVVIVLQLTEILIDELNLRKEPYIDKIFNLVVEGVRFAKDTFDEGNVYEETLAYVIDCCNELNIEVNDNRRKIIDTFIILALKNIK